MYAYIDYIKGFKPEVHWPPEHKVVGSSPPRGKELKKTFRRLSNRNYGIMGGNNGELGSTTIRCVLETVKRLHLLPSWPLGMEHCV